MSVTSMWRVLLAALLIACAGAPSSALASSRQDATEAGIIRALNGVRADHGLPRLHTSRGLAKAAEVHSASMQRTNSIGHGAYTKRVRRYVRTRKVGENLAWMAGCDANAIVEMWLHSAAHRRVMLTKSFRRIGVGRRGSGACFVTADFATAE